MAIRLSRTWGFLGLMIGLTVCILVVNTIHNDSRLPTATLKGSEFKLILANSQKEKEIGLSNTTILDQKKGMLFTYDKPELVGIWMKDMNFAIDVIWMNESREVVHIVENMHPDSYSSDKEAEVYRSETPSKYVLEVNSGVVSETKLRLGDMIELR